MTKKTNPTGVYRQVVMKAKLSRRIVLAWGLLNNNPTLYRVGISDGRIFLPQQLRIESAYICSNLIDVLDSNGDVPERPEVKLKPDYTLRA